MPATLRDVAERANASVRTVSNVVSGYSHVSPQMRQRVLQAIQELDYRPNPIARTLRTGRAGVLMLVVPEIDSPYFSELAQCVVEAAADMGYRVIIDQTGHDRARERQLLTGGERTMLVDGILFSPLVTPIELDEMRTRLSTPLLLLGEHTFDGTYDHVAIDNVQAAHDATNHLIAQGRTSIAAIGDQPLEDYATPLLRGTGYLKALLEAGIDPHRHWARPALHYRRIDGYNAAQDLIASTDVPDAIFAYSDLLAIGAMKAVFDAGLTVPDDISVIGIDDIEEGRFTRPTLSTISLDTPYIARTAVVQLTRRINDPETQATEVVAAHYLIQRDSTLARRTAPTDG